MLGKWVQHGLRWPDYQKRLFKKGFVHWSSTIHETPIHSGRFVELPATEKFAIVHHHTTDIDQLLHKTIQQAAKERFYNAQKNVSALDIYHRTEQEFPWREFEHEGIKDGMHGFITNKFMQVYRFLEFAYFWERTGMKEILGKSDIETLWNKDERIKELENELTILKSSKFYKAYQLILRMKAIFSKSMN
ncbi:MAG TPA: hypothetical protein VLH19_04865 [Patescibacteria group bacterium]|nr:hypothetical protein [Patescibacteria group bacterium]